MSLVEGDPGMSFGDSKTNCEAAVLLKQRMEFLRSPKCEFLEMFPIHSSIRNDPHNPSLSPPDPSGPQGIRALKSDTAI